MKLRNTRSCPFMNLRTVHVRHFACLFVCLFLFCFVFAFLSCYEKCVCLKKFKSVTCKKKIILVWFEELLLMYETEFCTHFEVGRCMYTLGHGHHLPCKAVAVFGRQVLSIICIISVLNYYPPKQGRGTW